MTFLAAGLTLYGQFASFHIALPLAQALALTPFILAIGNSPFSPGGIGTTQLVFTMGFAGFAAKGDLFALSLAVTAFNLLVRIPLGLMMGKPLAEEAVELNRELVPKFTRRAGLGEWAPSGLWPLPRAPAMPRSPGDGDDPTMLRQTATIAIGRIAICAALTLLAAAHLCHAAPANSRSAGGRSARTRDRGPGGAPVQRQIECRHLDNAGCRMR